MAKQLSKKLKNVEKERVAEKRKSYLNSNFPEERAESAITIDDLNQSDIDTFIERASTELLYVIPNKYFETVIEINPFLTHVAVMEELKKDESLKDKIMVLDFASFCNPGGGYLKGACAQEEVLCDNSDLFSYLNSKYAYNNFYAPNRNYKNIDAYADPTYFYTNHCMIVSGVHIYNEDKTIDYGNVSVLVTAAPNVNAYIGKDDNTCNNVKDCMGSTNYLQILRARIANIFIQAFKHNIDTLVLGAFGCGVFGNDPVTVARIFAEMAFMWRGIFKRIVFAIPEDKRNKNNEIFRKEIVKYLSHTDYKKPENFTSLSPRAIHQFGIIPSDEKITVKD